MKYLKTHRIGFVLILIFILNLSCQKSVFNRHAKGIVTDATDGTRIPFAQIAIQNEQTEFLGKTTYEILATGQANSNGAFEITYKTDRKGQNYAYAQAEHYYISTSQDKVDVNIDTRKNLEIKLTPKTNVIIHFDVSDTTISFIFFKFKTTASPQNCTVQKGLSQYFFETEGNKDNFYSYIIYYNNHQTVTVNGSVFCPKWDKPTATLKIKL